MEERFFWLGFNVFPGIGPARLQQLLTYFGTAKAAWEGRGGDLQKAGLGEKTLRRFDDFRSSFSLEEYAKKLQAKKVGFVTFQDELYPPRLKETQKAPFVLYLRGNRELLQQTGDENDKVVGIVGSRKVTQYGKEVTELLTQELVLAGCITISGLAMGVDSIAHQVTIDNNGKTIAVLGCGVDCCTPAENLSLYDAIIEKGGLIVSELPLGHPPSVGSFPARNRIVAGLSSAVVVTEGTEDSGALITAKFAHDFGRKVFAVPGPITSHFSKGPYKLIADGAKLVTSGGEILQELGIKNYESRIKKNVIRGDTGEEQVVLDLLSSEALSFDELARRTKMDSSALGSLLSLMEIKGMVTNTSGVYALMF